MKRLEKAKIANGAVNTMQNVWNHAQLKVRNRWRKINSEVGALPALLPPASNNNFEANMGHVPSLGQHSEELLQEFGLTDKIKEFRNKKII